MAPKKQAAIEQIEAMKAQGLSVETIRQKLAESGLTLPQINAVLPLPEKEAKKVEPVIPEAPQPKSQLMLEASHFLEFIHKKMHDCKPQHVGFRNDMLVWARKLKAGQ